MTPLTKMDSSLSGIFNTPPITDIESISNTPPIKISNQLEEDSDQVKQNIEQLIGNGNDALEYALELAKQSDSPRAFEVVSTLLGQLTDMNMKILEIHERIAKSKGINSNGQSAEKIVNNSIVFQGSTLELSKMISTMREENK